MLLRLVVKDGQFPGVSTKLDVYCKIRFGSQKKNLKAARLNSESVQWDEEMLLRVEHTEHTILIKVRGTDRFLKKSRKLGFCIVGLKQVMDSFEPIEVNVPLQDTQGSSIRMLISRGEETSVAHDSKSVEGIPLSHFSKLLPKINGEEYEFVEQVLYLKSGSQSDGSFLRGCVFLSNFRVLLIKEEDMNDSKTLKAFLESKSFLKHHYYPLNGPTSSILSIIKLGNEIEIALKSFLTVKIQFSTTDTCDSFQRALSRYVNTTKIGDLFAFRHGLLPRDGIPDGWCLYYKEGEMKRLGLPNNSWRLSTVNIHYEICDTYPNLWAVPSCVNDEQLKNVAKFRSKHRIPILSWIHPYSGASLTRCSQPLTGPIGFKEKDDLNLIQAIRMTNENAKTLMVLDARPKLNAVANQAKGAGFEDMSLYEGCQMLFLDIENIHVMRKSLLRLRDACYAARGQSSSSFSMEVEESHWLDHVSQVLQGSNKIVDFIANQRTSVLVHCSDGWDRTSQITSLAELCLDPFYRTFYGFQVLIEKNWLSFGHKFADRCGHLKVDSEFSPVFLQFIDCVWQIMRQYPSVFEFNEYFLLSLLDAVFSCQYGTFLGNSELQRILAKVHTQTSSFWTDVIQQAPFFINPHYEPNALVVFPSANSRIIRLWELYYLRWDESLYPLQRFQQSLQESFLAKMEREITSSYLKDVELNSRVPQSGFTEDESIFLQTMISTDTNITQFYPSEDYEDAIRHPQAGEEDIIARHSIAFNSSSSDDDTEDHDYIEREDGSIETVGRQPFRFSTEVPSSAGLFLITPFEAPVESIFSWFLIASFFLHRFLFD
eukprot:TRINITY_DN7441_c0_g1_i1.p1 TRINITY_DN7441_c0_g1~~TRINITY_DN7441_c0_g1_i1.p1  ORF type:complete len:825 (+),score=134.04 TRINITY_DN7441_c0_g1_i1:50-2524(+)